MLRALRASPDRVRGRLCPSGARRAQSSAFLADRARSVTVAVLLHASGRLPAVVGAGLARDREPRVATGFGIVASAVRQY
jgi:hypothetical protein